MNNETKVRKIESQMKSLWQSQFITPKIVDKYNNLLTEWKELTEYKMQTSNPITPEPYQGRLI